jgi:hypothetical protein
VTRKNNPLCPELVTLRLQSHSNMFRINVEHWGEIAKSILAACKDLHIRLSGDGPDTDFIDSFKLIKFPTVCHISYPGETRSSYFVQAMLLLALCIWREC